MITYWQVVTEEETANYTDEDWFVLGDYLETQPSHGSHRVYHVDGVCWKESIDHYMNGNIGIRRKAIFPTVKTKNESIPF